MRINQFVAQATGLGRRKVDKLIIDGQITINDSLAKLGQQVSSEDIIKYDLRVIELPSRYTTLLVNKPIGYVCSKDGQGSRTIYDLVPSEYQKLKSIGRLDKDSSGLIVLTNNGGLTQKLSHPSFNKQKIYEVKLSRELTKQELVKLETGQIRLDKKPSVLKVETLGSSLYKVTILEGRNRQIRRTLEKLSVLVVDLKRVQFGPYKFNDLKNQTWIQIS